MNRNGTDMLMRDKIKAVLHDTTLLFLKYKNISFNGLDLYVIGARKIKTNRF